MLMVNYLFCHVISIPMITIWIRPRPVTYRKMIYEDLKDKPEKLQELKDYVFLPSKAYPRRRGRKPKYDYLWISISEISKEEAERVAEFLKSHFGRPLVWYQKEVTLLDNSTLPVYVYVIPWRDPETGKSIRTGKGVFPELRGKIKEVIRGETPEAPEGDNHDMANTEELKPEWLPEDMTMKPEPFPEEGEKEEEEKDVTLSDEETIIKELAVIDELAKSPHKDIEKELKENKEALRKLEDYKKHLENNIKALRLEINSPVTMFRASKKRKLEKMKKELSKVNEAIREVKIEIRKLSREH